MLEISSFLVVEIVFWMCLKKIVQCEKRSISRVLWTILVERELRESFLWVRSIPDANHHIHHNQAGFSSPRTRAAGFFGYLSCLGRENCLLRSLHLKLQANRV